MLIDSLGYELAMSMGVVGWARGCPRLRSTAEMRSAFTASTYQHAFIILIIPVVLGPADRAAARINGNLFDRLKAPANSHYLDDSFRQWREGENSTFKVCEATKAEKREADLSLNFIRSYTNGHQLPSN